AHGYNIIAPPSRDEGHHHGADYDKGEDLGQGHRGSIVRLAQHTSALAMPQGQKSSRIGFPHGTKSAAGAARSPPCGTKFQRHWILQKLGCVTAIAVPAGAWYIRATVQRLSPHHTLCARSGDRQPGRSATRLNWRTDLDSRDR